MTAEEGRTGPGERERLLAMPPRQFLDEGHDLADLFEADRLGFLAEKAIADRILDSPAEKEQNRAWARHHLDEVAAFRDVDPEWLAASRWHLEIVSDDAFAERFAGALPEVCRRAQEEHVDRFLRPIVLIAVDNDAAQPLQPWEPTLHPGSPVLCGLCGEPVGSAHVQLRDRRGHYNGDEASDRDYSIYNESFDRTLAAICSTCLPPLPDVTLELSRFYLQVQQAIGQAASEARTVEGVAKAVKKLGQDLGLPVVDLLPLPGLSRRERGR